jgi:CBS domain-containing protein
VRPLSPGDRLGDVALRITEEGGGLPVTDATGRLIGVVTDRQLLLALFPPYIVQLRSAGVITRDFPALVRRAAAAADQRVEEVMTREPKHLTADDSEAHAAELFLHEGVRTLPVVSGDRLEGVIQVGDVIGSLLAACGRAADPTGRTA